MILNVAIMFFMHKISSCCESTFLINITFNFYVHHLDFINVSRDNFCKFTLFDRWFMVGGILRHGPPMIFLKDNIVVNIITLSLCSENEIDKAPRMGDFRE